MRERIGIHPGDFIRCPDRATARWHKVVLVGRRKDGSRYLTIRRGRPWRLLGFGALQRLEWGAVKAIGYGLRKARAPVLEATETHPKAPEATEAPEDKRSRNPALDSGSSLSSRLNEPGGRS